MIEVKDCETYSCSVRPGPKFLSAWTWRESQLSNKRFRRFFCGLAFLVLHNCTYFRQKSNKITQRDLKMSFKPYMLHQAWCQYSPLKDSNDLVHNFRVLKVCRAEAIKQDVPFYQICRYYQDSSAQEKKKMKMGPKYTAVKDLNNLMKDSIIHIC